MRLLQLHQDQRPDSGEPEVAARLRRTDARFPGCSTFARTRSAKACRRRGNFRNACPSSAMKSSTMQPDAARTGSADHESPPVGVRLLQVEGLSLALQIAHLRDERGRGELQRHFPADVEAWTASCAGPLADREPADCEPQDAACEYDLSKPADVVWPGRRAEDILAACWRPNYRLPRNDDFEPGNCQSAATSGCLKRIPDSGQAKIRPGGRRRLARMRVKAERRLGQSSFAEVCVWRTTFPCEQRG